MSPKHRDCSDGASTLWHLATLRADGWTQENLRLEISRQTHLSEKTKSRLEGFIYLPFPTDPKERKMLVEKGRFDWALNFYLSCSD
jgi:hypothetical protein